MVRVGVVLCLVLALFVIPGATPAGAADNSAPVLESLTIEADGAGAVVRVRARHGFARFVCTPPAEPSGDLWLDLPGARNGVRDAVRPGSALVGAAEIESHATGVRIRLRLANAALAGLEDDDEGLRIRLRAIALPSTGGGDAADLPVSIGDKLEITVFAHEEYTKTVDVRGDGTISYPPIGDILVAGKPVAQIRAEIAQTLGRDYLVDPQVSVEQSRWATVLGEIRTPGRYALKRNARVVDLLAEAGGPTKDAGNRITITRRLPGGETHEIAADRDRLLGKDDETNVTLQHGDIVRVAEKDVFYIRGEVAKAGSYYLENGMTVLKAISIAGGYSPFANRRVLELLRSGRGGMNEKKVVNIKAIENGKEADVPLGPNDTIIVLRRAF